MSRKDVSIKTESGLIIVGGGWVGIRSKCKGERAYFRRGDDENILN